MSQTLIAPTRTNVIPSQRLAELLSMVWTVVTTRNTSHRGHTGGLTSWDRTDTLRVAEVGLVLARGLFLKESYLDRPEDRRTYSRMPDSTQSGIHV